MEIIDQALQNIHPLNSDAQQAALEHQQQLTKPQGSLGMLEAIVVKLAGITGNPLPTVPRKTVIVMAGDHGVTAEGVSAFPSEVTPQMVLNFLHGGAAINVLARQMGAHVAVVDIGVASDIEHPRLIVRKVGHGTANMAKSPAMTREQAEQAIAIGIEIVTAEAHDGLDLVATGDMGIGNTTASSAIIASLLGLDVAEVTGRGTGLDDAGLQHKIAIIEQALAVNVPDVRDPIDVLARVGGFEIAGLVGVILGAAALRIPVVIDGLISSAAALVAYELEPTIRDYLFAGHLSVERGHRLILEHIKLEPLLRLDMRLGEGSGATLAMAVIEAAVRTHGEMATFASAGVSDKEQ